MSTIGTLNVTALTTESAEISTSNQSASSTNNYESSGSRNLVNLDETDVNVLLTIVYLAIFLIGVIGNVCNCLVIADSRNKYMKTATNYYLFSLSVSDLLLLIFGLPHDLVNLWHPTPYLFSEFVCISRGWISEASTYASVLVIVAFTVERYLAICHPLRTHTLSRLSRSVKIIILIWLVASSCALLVVMQYGVISIVIEESSNRTTNGGATAGQVFGAQCTVVTRNETIFELSVLIFFIIPMALITILYVRLGCHLRHKTRAIKEARERTKQSLRTSNVSNRLFIGRQSISDLGLQQTQQTQQQQQLEQLELEQDDENRETLASLTNKRSSISKDQMLTVDYGAAISSESLPVRKGSEQVFSANIKADLSCPLAPVNSTMTSTRLSPSFALETSDATNTDHDDNNNKKKLMKISSTIPSNCQLELPEFSSALCSSQQPSPSHTTLRQREKQFSGKQQLALSSNVNTANMQSVIKMLVFVVVMFFICWAPFHAQRLMAIYVTNPTSEQEFIHNLLNHVSGISYYISAVVNPILYSLFSLKFRQAFQDTFGSSISCCRFVATKWWPR